MDPVTALLAVNSLIGSSTIVHVLFDTLIDSVIAQAKSKIIRLPADVQQSIKRRSNTKRMELNDFLYSNHPLLLPYHKNKQIQMNNNNNNNDMDSETKINDGMDIISSNELILDFDNKFAELNMVSERKSNGNNRDDYELQFCDDLLNLVTKKLQKMEVYIAWNLSEYLLI